MADGFSADKLNKVVHGMHDRLRDGELLPTGDKMILDGTEFLEKHPAFAAGVKEVLTNSLVPGGAIILNEGVESGIGMHDAEPGSLAYDLEAFVMKHAGHWVVYTAAKGGTYGVERTLVRDKEDNSVTDLIGKQGIAEDLWRDRDTI